MHLILIIAILRGVATFPRFSLPINTASRISRGEDQWRVRWTDLYMLRVLEHDRSNFRGVICRPRIKHSSTKLLTARRWKFSSMRIWVAIGMPEDEFGRNSFVNLNLPVSVCQVLGTSNDCKNFCRSSTVSESLSLTKFIEFPASIYLFMFGKNFIFLLSCSAETRLWNMADDSNVF